jgi:hypothetical protein
MISYSGVSNSKSARGAHTMTASVPFSAPLTGPLLVRSANVWRAMRKLSTAAGTPA